MPDYEEMYFKLAARVADAIDLLTAAQRTGEDVYTNDEERKVSEEEPV